METKRAIMGLAAREKILAGVEAIAPSCAATLGPRGRTALIQSHSGIGAPHATKDGVSVLRKSLPIKDPFASMAAEVLKQASEKTVEQAGDGTTQTCVIAAQLIRDGIKLVNSGSDPMSLKRGMNKACDKIIEHLAKSAQPVTAKDIKAIATISANGDAEVGDVISSAIEAVGRDGQIVLEEGKGLSTKLRTAQGFEFDRGAIHPAFYNDQEKQRCVFEDAFVWLINGNLTSPNQFDDIMPMLEAVSRTGKPLVIMAENIEGQPLATLAVNNVKQSIKLLCIKLPGYGSRRTELATDIAVLTGATLRDSSLADDLMRGTKIEELGQIKRIVSTKESTILVGVDGREEAIEAHVAKIRAQIGDEPSKWDADRSEQRLAKLVGGVAVIEVGAQTEIEMKEIKDRYEDAIAATRGCIETGFLPGGGSALLKARSSVMAEGFTTGDREQDAGVDLVLRACAAPFKQILANSGEIASERAGVIMAEITQSDKPELGYDAQKHQIVNMVEAGIIDPAKVCKVALQNAVSVAGLLLTTESLICNEPSEPQHQHAGQNMMM